MRVRTLLADDHAVFRSGVRALLEREPDIEVVGEAGTFAEAMEALATTAVDVLVLDLSMPGKVSGPRSVEAVLAVSPDLKIVVLTMHEDARYAHETFRVGGRAFVLKKSGAPDLLSAIRTTHRGGFYMDPALGGQLAVDRLASAPHSLAGPSAALTPRETQVLALLALGHTNTEVATQLAISERTVEIHRSHVMSKLALKSRAELVRYAIEHGLLKLD